jgi:hypothetical protein
VPRPNRKDTGNKRLPLPSEAAARDLPRVSLEDARQLVHLYANRGSPKHERAALRRNVELGDVVMLADGREALVTARVETDGGQLAALLEGAIALTSDDSIV